MLAIKFVGAHGMALILCTKVVMASVAYNSALSTCLPASPRTADLGYADDFRGWYDVQGCGICLDYCRWVGHSGSGGDPSQRTTYGSSWWSCRLAGQSSSDYSPSSFFRGRPQLFDFVKRPAAGLANPRPPPGLAEKRENEQARLSSLESQVRTLGTELQERTAELQDRQAEVQKAHDNETQLLAELQRLRAQLGWNRQHEEQESISYPVLALAAVMLICILTMMTLCSRFCSDGIVATFAHTLTPLEERLLGRSADVRDMLPGGQHDGLHPKTPNVQPAATAILSPVAGNRPEKHYIGSPSEAQRQAAEPAQGSASANIRNQAAVNDTWIVASAQGSAATSASPSPSQWHIS